jgi:hypothetical protein
MRALEAIGVIAPLKRALPGVRFARSAIADEFLTIGSGGLVPGVAGVGGGRLRMGAKEDE